MKKQLCYGKNKALPLKVKRNIKLGSLNIDFICQCFSKQKRYKLLFIVTIQPPKVKCICMLYLHDVNKYWVVVVVMIVW